MNKNIEILIDGIKNVVGNRLLSVILYGSYVDQTESKTSDINLMVVIEQLTAIDLKKMHSAIKKWQKSSAGLPVFMGKTEWFASSDVYPMEYADIKDRHSILYGEDIVLDLKIDKCHLRLQCESETKNLLIRLRQGYVANSSDNKITGELIVNSSKSLVAIFKTVLRLTSDEKVSNDKNEIINKVSSLIGLDAEVFAKILEFRDNKKAIRSNEYDLIIQKLIDSIYDVLKYVDKINTCKEV
ncbi:MAG TPA: hypothetical protein P5556_10985 [Candidatus Gastranaerophilales bacterium]|nr:hypothetical protein [Candidatus Gastranaerophilales bacterium]